MVELPLVDPAPQTRWFDAKSCVVSGEDGIRRVFVGGRLMGAFGAKDYAERNVMLIALSEEPKRSFRSGPCKAAFCMRSSSAAGQEVRRSEVRRVASSR